VNRSLTQEEIRTHQHQLLPNPSEFQLVRYEVDVDPDAQKITAILLTLRSHRSEVRRLRFINPTIPEFGPLQVPLGPFAGAIYVVDTTFRGWESRARIEVGSLAEEKPTFEAVD
jgi:hypothetical protein